MLRDHLYLEIVTPKKIVFEGDVRSFYAPGIKGNFQILPNHAPLISSLVPGKIKVSNLDGTEIIYTISSGTAEISKGKITILAEAVETIKEIDIERAKLAKERAEKRLKSKEPGIDIERAKIALLRALNRIKIASGN
jgi:F-type H+-transporting ATPase subunit epsilon